MSHCSSCHISTSIHRWDPGPWDPVWVYEHIQRTPKSLGKTADSHGLTQRNVICSKRHKMDRLLLLKITDWSSPISVMKLWKKNGGGGVGGGEKGQQGFNFSPCHDENSKNSSKRQRGWSCPGCGRGLSLINCHPLIWVVLKGLH